MFTAVKGKILKSFGQVDGPIQVATNDDPWGPTGQQMDEVVVLFGEDKDQAMADILDRLREKGNKWRRCYKCLLLLDHMARNGPMKDVEYLREFVPEIQQIASEFQYVGSNGVDHGISVRERAKKLLGVLSDPLLLKEERSKAQKTRTNIGGGAFEGFGNEGGTSSEHIGQYPPTQHRREDSGSSGNGMHSSPTWKDDPAPKIKPHPTSGTQGSSPSTHAAGHIAGTTKGPSSGNTTTSKPSSSPSNAPPAGATYIPVKSAPSTANPPPPDPFAFLDDLASPKTPASPPPTPQAAPQVGGGGATASRSAMDEFDSFLSDRLDEGSSSKAGANKVEGTDFFS